MKMSKFASGESATLAIDNDKVEGKVASFVIREDMLPRIQFLREGEFKEQAGAAALRLGGNVADVPSFAGGIQVLPDDVDGTRSSTESILRNAT